MDPTNKHPSYVNRTPFISDASVPISERNNGKTNDLDGAFVRFTFHKDSNVIMTVTGNASHMRGSEFCQHKQLSPGYRPMGLSKNSAC